MPCVLDRERDHPSESVVDGTVKLVTSFTVVDYLVSNIWHRFLQVLEHSN